MCIKLAPVLLKILRIQKAYCLRGKFFYYFIKTSYLNKYIRNNQTN